ncbi:MAG: glutamate cyclase domain-containing protein [Hyphomicrobiales bacterium]
MAIDEIVGDSIDRAISIEMRFGSGLPRGVIHQLYDAARRQAGGPLCLRAAQGLKDRVRKGDHVFVVTGAGTPPWLPRGETDGPIGAAALARAVEIGLGAKPVLLGEERNLASTIGCTEAAGLVVVDAETFAQRNGCAHALPLPLGVEAGRTAADELFARFSPAAVIFVEKGGPNSKGVFHSIMGTGREPELMANAHFLADLAAAKGVLSIGVGDGGNEIGCGAILGAVQEIQPFGRKCQCPCGAGVATVTSCDHLVLASVSNWGGYGVAAALAGLLERPSVLHDTDTELRMLDRCIEAGAMDGAYARLIPFVDGTTAAVQTSLITILHQIVANGLMAYDRGF